MYVEKRNLPVYFQKYYVIYFVKKRKYRDYKGLSLKCIIDNK